MVFDGAGWRTIWRSTTDLDPRLVRRWHVGPLTAVAWWSDERRPRLAVGTETPAGERHEHRLRLWDVLSGQVIDLPVESRVLNVTFSPSVDGLVLVSGHYDGARLWDVESGTELRSRIEIGQGREVGVVETRDGTQMVVRNGVGWVGRFWLPSGVFVRGSHLHEVGSVATGRLTDGRAVMVTAQELLSVIDLDNGELISLLASPGRGSAVKKMALWAEDGRDRLTVIKGDRVLTVDPVTGEPVGEPIMAHREGQNRGVMSPRTGSISGDTELAVVGGAVAVSTRWRVHLWDPHRTAPAAPPLAGPVAAARLQAVHWQGRDMLLTGSQDDEVVALWGLDRPVDRAPGHEQRIVQITRAEPADVVVSVDDGALIVARDCADGRLMNRVAVPGVERPHVVAAWSDDVGPSVAIGAGNDYYPDRYLHRLNLTTGELRRPEIDLGIRMVHHVVRAEVDGQAVLVTYARNRLQIRGTDDAEPLGETVAELGSRVNGFLAATAPDGRPVLVISTWWAGMRVYALDDLSASPLLIPEAGDDAALAVSGSHIVALQHHDSEMRRRRPGHFLRVWDTSGRLLQPGVHRPSDVTHAAVRSWPQVYVAHADRTIALVDLATGRELCSPLSLPGAVISLATTRDGDLLTGIGSDVTRYHPEI
jgi:hypothetical protein